MMEHEKDGRNECLYQYDGQLPSLGRSVFLAPGCRIIGDVVLGEGVSVWFNAVIRGDINRIRIGADSNIQDNAVLHVGSPGAEAETGALLIGQEVVVGHGAVVHACSIGSQVLIGMNATILDGAHIGNGVIIAAGAVVAPGMEVPAGSLVAGVPGQVRRALRPEEIAGISASARRYRDYAQKMQESLRKT